MTAFLPSQNIEDAEDGGRIVGVAVGIVAKDHDTSGLGRVKVRFPWHKDPKESFWARMAVPMAGKDQGTYFGITKETEVLVAFDMGKIEHPYILGALWNGQDPPPEKNADGKNDVRLIRSRDNHELTFKDGADPYVELKSNHGHSVKMSDTEVTVVDKGGNKFTIDVAKGGISVESKSTVLIKSEKIDIEAGAALNLKARAVTIKGDLVRIN